MTTVCSGCNRIKVNGEWVVVPDRPAMDRDSHGICPDCVKVFYPKAVNPFPSISIEQAITNINNAMVLPKATRFDCVRCPLSDLDSDGVPDGCGQVIGQPCIAPGKRSPWD